MRPAVSSGAGQEIRAQRGGAQAGICSFRHDNLFRVLPVIHGLPIGARDK